MIHRVMYVVRFDRREPITGRMSHIAREFETVEAARMFIRVESADLHRPATNITLHRFLVRHEEEAMSIYE